MNSGARVVMLSMHADRRFVAEALRAGAQGYVLKDSAFEELVAAIRAVAQGRSFLSAPVADLVVRDYVERMSQPSSPGGPALSARERQVLQLIAEGASTKEIAAHLGVSIKTIDTHRRQIMERLNLHSIAELTKYAIREGLTEL
jgi:DNA-binding NarL/FixJ family response regulator